MSLRVAVRNSGVSTMLIGADPDIAQYSPLDELTQSRADLVPSLPPDNPNCGVSGALPEIWSYGHRNPQGAAIHPASGELWASEDGRQGGDELNRVPVSPAVRGRLRSPTPGRWQP